MIFNRVSRSSIRQRNLKLCVLKNRSEILTRYILIKNNFNTGKIMNYSYDMVSINCNKKNKNYDVICMMLIYNE